MTDFLFTYKPGLTESHKKVRVNNDELVERGVSLTPKSILEYMIQSHSGIYYALCEAESEKEIIHCFCDSGDLEIFTSDDLNHYHDYVFEDGLTPSESRDFIIRKAIAGELPRYQFEEWNRAGLNRIVGHYRDRRYYTMNCSWAIYTIEWIEDIAQLVKGKRVVEICAGRGILGPIMKKHGIEWICTDFRPPRGVTHVKKLDAVEAVKTLEPDIVFASWIPYKSTELDYEIACMGIPMIIVGEGWGGCTGSQKFWGSYTWLEEEEKKDDDVPRPYEVISARSVKEDFRDVPQWDTVHDYTSFVIPKGRKPKEFFNL